MTSKKKGFRKINKIPLFDKIITTANRQVATASGLILTDASGGKNGKLLTTQVVLKCGEHVPDIIKEGTTVEIDMLTFPRRKVADAAHGVGPDVYEIDPPLYIDDDDEEFMQMSVRNLLYVIED